ncbi:carboxylesterase/lipase family protein [Actinomadura nitritigenes]|uniref:Carboxylic ester hydrolase n=1 Tax=Actinomadura nitritigenes TaxID=134602 RepID=A0ABS3R2G0_9ACTN|nr:carboxylesterase family protein [Actinomadura nitritigenes]MBO2440434.1 carboxylesterase family protein [Actinomadura nitritigenes]
MDFTSDLPRLVAAAVVVVGVGACSPHATSIIEARQALRGPQGPQGPQGPRETVETDKGRVKGVAADGVIRFQGIPYAAPPIGRLRWRPPAAAAPWKGVRSAAEPGPICAQPGAKGSSEDCLYLDVTAPARAGRRPVVVWLHGGAFSSGSGSEYDAARMAEKGDVVVVTVNSRLGALGFFAHPRLRDSGDYGLQDQQAALRWVRANAAAFGGDPGKVTLMGQSSGGASVCAQLTSPQAAGLFHRAIIESGSCLQNWPRNMLAPGDAASRYWAPVTELAAKGRTALGCRTLGCLRAKPTAEVLSLNGAFHQPAYGTAVLPKNPVAALAEGAFHRVPVLQGNTKDEHRLFAALFTLDRPITAARYRRLLTETFGEQQAARVARRYPPGRSASLAWAAVGTDRAWTCPTLAADRLLARHVPVYSFEFADERAPAPDLKPGFPMGAYHGSELPYLFGMANVRLAPAQVLLSNRMIAAWTRFARTGAPGGGWRPFPETMQLTPGRDLPVDAGAEHHCAFWR